MEITDLLFIYRSIEFDRIHFSIVRVFLKENHCRALHLHFIMSQACACVSRRTRDSVKAQLRRRESQLHLPGSIRSRLASLISRDRFCLANSRVTGRMYIHDIPLHLATTAGQYLRFPDVRVMGIAYG